MRRKAIAELKRRRAERSRYDWRAVARPKQLAPEGDWTIWFVMAGRGFGKTRTGAEWVREQVAAGKKRIALLAPTAADARDVMIEGESGLLSVFPPDERPLYEPSKRRVTFKNGAIATAYSADEPERLRGPQHDAAWCDEPASYRRPEAFDMLMFGLRLGDKPQCCMTGTPKPTKLVREVIKRKDCVLVRGSTSENEANLASSFLDQIVAKYQGTRLGRQELDAEILEDVPGALWSMSMIEPYRDMIIPAMRRIVVGVDPNVSSSESADECGIIVAGLGMDGRGYVLADRSGKHSPAEWGKVTVGAYQQWEADKIVAEVNNGGDLVARNIRAEMKNAPVRQVRASRGKQVRAEPVAALYERGAITHAGVFLELEEQLTTWDATASDKSPDRLDALVWAFTDLMLAQPTQAPIAIARDAGGRIGA